VYNDDNAGETDLPCVVAKYSPKSNYIGAAYYDGYKGTIRVFKNLNKSLHQEFTLGKFDKNIYNCLCWKPSPTDENALLLAVDTEAVITKINVETGVKEETKTDFKHARFTCCDFSYSGRYFVTGGDDYNVWFWDFETSEVVESDSFYTKHNSHSNRVFCAKYMPFDDNVCVTAGWDMNIILHDYW